MISAEGNGTLYFPSGAENNHITRLTADTCESETIHVLGFPPRCLAAQGGFVCCGGEYGEFAVIKDANQHGGDEIRNRTNVDDALSSNFQSQLRSLESPPGQDAALSSSFSRDMFNLLEQRLNGPAKSWTSSSHKYGTERVNCITIWEPPKATSLFPARDGHYATPVAVLSNNDKTVTIVGLHESEFFDEIKLPDCVNRSLISPDGTLLASICDDPFLYLHTRKPTSTKGRIGDESYEWKSLPRVRLESPAKDARDDCRGSFAASFSPSGRFLAVGVQNGTIRVFDTAALQTPDADPLVAAFTTSRHPEVHGAVRDMAFCPGPYDLLAWTEHRGRIGIADARSNFAQRQTVILDRKEDYDHLSLTDRSTIDPRLLEQRNERSPRSGSTMHLARLLSQASSPQPPPHLSTNSDVTSRVNRPFSPEETAILDAVTNERRRREARDTRDARDLIAEDLRASSSWRPHLWAERVSVPPQAPFIQPSASRPGDLDVDSRSPLFAPREFEINVDDFLSAPGRQQALLNQASALGFEQVSSEARHTRGQPNPLHSNTSTPHVVGPVFGPASLVGLRPLAADEWGTQRPPLPTPPRGQQVSTSEDASLDDARGRALLGDLYESLGINGSSNSADGVNSDNLLSGPDRQQAPLSQASALDVEQVSSEARHANGQSNLLRPNTNTQRVVTPGFEPMMSAIPAATAEDVETEPPLSPQQWAREMANIPSSYRPQFQQWAEETGVQITSPWRQFVPWAVERRLPPPPPLRQFQQWAYEMGFRPRPPPPAPESPPPGPRSWRREMSSWSASRLDAHHRAVMDGIAEFLSAADRVNLDNVQFGSDRRQAPLGQASALDPEQISSEARHTSGQSNQLHSTDTQRTFRSGFGAPSSLVGTQPPPPPPPPGPRPRRRVSVSDPSLLDANNVGPDDLNFDALNLDEMNFGEALSEDDPLHRIELTRARQRETLARILDRDRRDRDTHRSTLGQASLDAERERRAPTPRRRTSIMQAISQETDRIVGVAPPSLNRVQSSGNNEQQDSSAAEPRPPYPPFEGPPPFAPSGRLTSGWADLEALYNITGNETSTIENVRVQPSRTRRAIPVINDAWNDDLSGFGTRRSYPPRMSSRDHTQNPDDTAGLTWSEDGQTL